VVDFIAKQGKPSYELDIHQQIIPGRRRVGRGVACDEDEAVIEQCIEVIRQRAKGERLV